AQVKSSILLAGLYADGVTAISEPGKSRDHTERMLKAMGVDLDIKNLEVRIKGGAMLKPLDITVPGDLSSAAFFIVAGILVPRSEIVIRNTGINPTRTGIIDILKMMGADIRFENEKKISEEPVADIYVKHSELKGMNIDGKMVLRAIDEFPVMCVAAAKAHGTTKITGARELRVKESDRIASIASELKKMGARIEEFEDGLIIVGSEDLKPAIIQSYHDHRIAMSMLVAGLTVKGETTVKDIECIDTSFPDFIKILGELTK
ncbi:MAG: 3-phosphoshikimate 1-carboxyvinyltransferase, partial [Candidatus Aenigmarchaeota archaeon]|nr:3-phosphoshikimate 1-carboxyvinyltransferase [Candidatus Aenigmarchaeota archaeon]